MLHRFFLTLVAFVASLLPALAAAAPFAYITNSASGTVSVIDTATNTGVGLPINVGAFPYGVAVNSAGTRVYVANQNSNDVSVIDAGTNTVVATVALGTTEPIGVAVNPAGTRVYVANRGTSNVSVINTSNNTVVDTLTGFGLPIAFGQFIQPAAAAGTPTAVAVPTLSQWATLLLAALLAAAAIVAMRQRMH